MSSRQPDVRRSRRPRSSGRRGTVVGVWLAAVALLAVTTACSGSNAGATGSDTGTGGATTTSSAGSGSSSSTSTGDSATGESTPGTSSTSSSAKPLPVRVGALTASLQLYTAAKTTFAKNGLDVQSITPIAGGPDLLSAALGGSVDVFSTSASLTETAASQGRCTQYLSFEHGSTNNLIGNVDEDWPNAGKGLDAFKDMQGRKLGITQLGGAIQTWLQTAFVAAGVDPKTVTFVAVGSGAASTAALTHKTVDAILSYPPAEEILGAGNFKLLFKFAGNPDSPWASLMNTGVAATCEWIQKNPEAALAVCRSMWDYYDLTRDSANKDQMLDYIKELDKTEGAAGEDILEKQNASLPKTPLISQEIWEAQQKFVPSSVKIRPYSEAVYAPCNSGDPRTSK